MAESYIKKPFSLVRAMIPATKGSGVGTMVLNGDRYGQVVVVSYYFKMSSSVARSATLATLDIPNEFPKNYFNNDVVLAVDTKTLLANRALSSGTEISGTIVGLMKP